jgi:hypothetical protein
MKNKYLVILFVTVCFSCKKEIAPENPCGDYKHPNADFIIEQATGERENIGTRLEDYIWYSNPYVSKDIIMENGFIQFRSQFNDTNIYKHTWYVGAEVLRNYKVWRDFSSVTQPANITIHHVIKWKPNLLCNPKETGYDSVSFTFKISDRLKDFATFGKYRMVYDTLGAPTTQDSVDIEFYRSIRNFKDSVALDPKINDGTDNRIKGLYTLYYNAQKGYYVVPSNTEGLENYRLISNTYAVFRGGFIDNLKIFLNNKNEAFIEYWNYDPNALITSGVKKQYKLKGRKVND